MWCVYRLISGEVCHSGLSEREAKRAADAMTSEAIGRGEDARYGAAPEREAFRRIEDWVARGIL